jgi:hypothetical protein
MTKITIHDTYLHKDITFYSRRDFKDKDEVEQVLRLKDYLYFPIVEVKPTNLIEKLLIPIFYEKTTDVKDILFFHFKYLINE